MATHKPVSVGRRVTVQNGSVYLRPSDKNTSVDTLMLVVDSSSDNLADRATVRSTTRRPDELLPSKNTPVIMIHGPAPIEAGVVEIGQAWNWVVKTLCHKSLHQTAFRLVFHLEHKPHDSQLEVRIGNNVLAGPVDIGNPADHMAFRRAAWRCAIQLASDQLREQDPSWRVARPIYAKAFQLTPTR